LDQDDEFEVAMQSIVLMVKSLEVSPPALLHNRVLTDSKAGVDMRVYVAAHDRHYDKIVRSLFCFPRRLCRLEPLSPSRVTTWVTFRLQGKPVSAGRPLASTSVLL